MSGGAFTGANPQGKAGFFEAADGGTIFLDEINSMPIELQSVLLRTIQEKEIRRVGAQKNIYVDIRIISACNKNMEELIADGKFRADLYYRLNTLKLTMPDLETRKEDIPPLCRYFLKRYSAKYSVPIPALSPEDSEILLKRSWPGNVRELQNRIKRAVLLTETPVLELPDLNADSQTDIRITEKTPDILPLKDENSEREAIANALQACNGHREQTARLLNVNSSTLYRKMKKYGIR